jgi:hypothetical protein
MSRTSFKNSSKAVLLEKSFRMKKSIFALICLFLGLFPAFGTTWSVANNGLDTNSGSLSAPFLTIQRAQTSVNPGDTVWVRGGTYTMTEAQIAAKNGIYAYVTNLTKSGSAGKRIYYWAYPGEKPVFDYSTVKPATYRVFAFNVTGSYIHLKGLEVTGVQVTILTHTQSECFHNEGSNNIYEQLSMHDGMAIGFYLTKGSNNLVLNCDAYRNWDSVSENGVGGNTDGFGFHPNAKGYTGNIVRGCRAWFNSDDGYDCINASEGTRFENCWAFYNGYTSAFVSKGDGNGFKVGGYGAAPAVSGLPNPIPSNTVQFCMAYRNKANGFYSNHHVAAANYFYNNTAYRNSTNFNMLSQKITKSPYTNADTSIDCPGYSHVLYNNLSFKTKNDTLNLGSCTITYNSFSPGSGVIVDANDFLSTDETLLVAARKPDGSLPENNFLRLKSNSDLLNEGKVLTFPYSGSAPDFGAFEYQEPNALMRQKSTTDDLTLLTDAESGRQLQLKFSLSSASPVSIHVFDFQGRTVYRNEAKWLDSGEHIEYLDLSPLSKSIYLVHLETKNPPLSTTKAVSLR